MSHDRARRAPDQPPLEAVVLEAEPKVEVSALDDPDIVARELSLELGLGRVQRFQARSVPAHAPGDDHVVKLFPAPRFAKLRPLRGTITADAAHRFNRLYESGALLESGRNADGRRKFRDAEPRSPRSPRRAACSVL